MMNVQIAGGDLLTYDATIYNFDSEGFVVFSRGADFVAAVAAHMVVSIELASN